MEHVSVSKGVFPYHGAYRIGDGRRRRREDEFASEPWYLAFKENWSFVQDAVERIREEMFLQILADVEAYVARVNRRSPGSLATEIPTAILLTGVNVPDHNVLYEGLRVRLERITRRLAVIWARDCGSLKNLLEETVHQIINGKGEELVKKSQCTMRNLRSWYRENCEEEEPVVVVVTDFESCSPAAVRDFISVLSSYAGTIRFVLIFGVATTLHAIHRSLSYDVTSKLNIKVFHTKTQVDTLSVVVENVVLRSDHPFRLTGRAFQLLTDIFLFYDFSVASFLQGYKSCMMQHFYENELSPLCCRPEKLRSRLRELPTKSKDEARRMPSIEKYLKTEGLEDLSDERFEETLLELLERFHKRVDRFLVILKCLHSVTSTLPNSPLGKQLREFYTKAVYQSRLTESQQYKDSLQLLTFLSKKELLDKLDGILRILESSKDSELATVRKKFIQLHTNVQEAAIEVAPVEEFTTPGKMSRVQLKEALLKLSQKRSTSAFKTAQLEVIEYLDKVFTEHLENPGQLPGAEIFCFADGAAARQRIRGSSRAAVHAALTDPRFYLNCNCCKLDAEEAIRGTLPDICIAYKLHLESRKLINIYDWLQAFLVIVQPENSGEQREIPPELHARFTRAVAELEFLGFIKSSTKKTDHVKRLG